MTRPHAKKGTGGNKLRTYFKFKSAFETENYVNMSFTRGKRSAIAKFRCGVAPIRLETGRYEGLSVEDRVCPYGCNVVECEKHVLLECTLYDDLRYSLLESDRVLHNNFDDYNMDDKLSTILTDVNLVYESANFCQSLLIIRRNFMYLNR